MCIAPCRRGWTLWATRGASLGPAGPGGPGVVNPVLHPSSSALLKREITFQGTLFTRKLFLISV